MLSIFDPFRDLDFADVLLRVIMAVICGMLIGIERSMRNRPAGFRTHILVCLGAAAAATTGLYAYTVLKLPADVTRISGQIITGLGFIGAGTIVITKNLSIKGLTTAAGLWTTGIIGIAIGSGYYELGILGTAFVLLAETVLIKLSGSIKSAPEYTVEITYDNKNSLDSVLRMCKDNRMSIVNLRIVASDEAEDTYVALVLLRGGVKCSEMIRRIKVIDGIVNAVGI